MHAQEQVTVAPSNFSRYRQTQGRRPSGEFARVAAVPMRDAKTLWFYTGSGSRPTLDRVISETSQWHDPVGHVLEAARRHEEEDGRGSSRLTWERLADSWRKGAGGREWSSGRAVFIGDACHGIPPNLAQVSRS